ncbi:MAG: hypothetical protein ABSC01_01085 [Verrucomicrobiota bacterium]|jgi:hypothetical protein
MFVFFLGPVQQMDLAFAFGKTLHDGPDLPMGYNPNSPGYHFRNQLRKNEKGERFPVRLQCRSGILPDFD